MPIPRVKIEEPEDFCLQAREINSLASEASANLHGLYDYADMDPIFDKFMDCIPEHIKDEMRAIVGDHRAQNLNLYCLNFADEVLRLLGNTEVTACSSLAVWDDDKIVVGRNLDYYFMQTVMRERLLRYDFAPRDGRLGFTSWAWPGFLGVVTGYNEAGIWYATHTLPDGERSAHGMPNGILGRIILENAKSIADAVMIIAKNHPSCPANIMLADLNINDAEIVEADYETVNPWDIVTSNNSYGDNYLVCTNQRFRGAGSSDSKLRNERLHFWADTFELCGCDLPEMTEVMGEWGILNEGTLYSIVTNGSETLGAIGTGTQVVPKYEPF